MTSTPDHDCEPPGFVPGDPNCGRCHGLSHTTIPPCRGCGGTCGEFTPGDHDGHAIDLGPVTVGETLPPTPSGGDETGDGDPFGPLRKLRETFYISHIGGDGIGAAWGPSGCWDVVKMLDASLGEIDRLRAEVAALRATDGDERPPTAGEVLARLTADESMDGLDEWTVDAGWAGVDWCCWECLAAEVERRDPSEPMVALRLRESDRG